MKKLQLMSKKPAKRLRGHKTLPIYLGRKKLGYVRIAKTEHFTQRYCTLDVSQPPGQWGYYTYPVYVANKLRGYTQIQNGKRKAGEVKDVSKLAA